MQHSNNKSIAYFNLCSFDWAVDRNEIPKRSLEVIVKNDVSFFSRAKTTMGKVSPIFMLHIFILLQII
jgi:hypothetical protein